MSALPVRPLFRRTRGVVAIAVSLLALLAATTGTVVARMDNGPRLAAADVSAPAADALSDARLAPAPVPAKTAKPQPRRAAEHRPAPRPRHHATPRPTHRPKPHRHVDPLAAARGLSAWIDLY